MTAVCFAAPSAGFAVRWGQTGKSREGLANLCKGMST
jgi:hypothetical protein